MQELNKPDWDTMFMTAAFLFAQKSPDEETKIGAILINKHKQLLAEGFNGFPAGCKDETFPKTRPGKYFFIRHAEDNCIDNATVIPEPELCTLYVTAKPCHECLKKIIQHRIGRVVYAGVKTASASSRNNEEYRLNYEKLLDGIPLEMREFDPVVLKNNTIALLRMTHDYIQDRC